MACAFCSPEEAGHLLGCVLCCISAIRSALSYAVRAEIVPTNKLLGPHRLFLHDERKIPQILTVDEVKALLSAASNLRHKAAILAELCVQRINEYIFEKPKAFYHSIDKWFKKLLKKTEVKGCTLHNLRQTCNTLMKDAGITPEVAMQVMGHSTYTVNQRYYTGMLTGQQKIAVNSIP